MLQASTLLVAAPPRIKLRYEFTPVARDGKSALHIVLDLEQLPPTGTELVLPSSWGDATGLTGAVVNLRAESPGVSIADTPDPSVKHLQGYARGRARLSYDLVQDWEGPLRESVRHRVHLEPAYVEMNTSNGLIHPKLDLAAPVDCSFEWKVSPQWSVATSFGVGQSRQSYRGSWDALENALFVAGDFRIHKAKMGKGWLVIATRGEWNLPDEDRISQITRLIRVERAFWKDDDFPYFLVTLVPFGPGQSGRGGGGFTNAFSLHTSPESSFSGGLLSLLAHEVFHTWNPYKLGRMRSPAEGIYWFTEGFTTYYQDLLLWRSGLLSLEEFVQRVNRFLRDYHLSPDRNASVAELIDSARKNKAKNQISYERGAAIALWLDTRIRSNTQARASLDTLMLDLFRQAGRRRDRFPDLTSDRIFGAVAQHVDPEDLRRFRFYVESGITVEAPSQALAPCSTREFVDMPSFELGIDRVALVEKHLVAGIKPGSEADKAGLREGDTVIGTSVYWNDTSKPVKLTVQRGKTRAPIEYYPRGPSLGRVPQYIVNRDRLQQDPQSCRPLIH